MFKSSAGYEHDWYVIKSDEKPFTGFDHVTNPFKLLFISKVTLASHYKHLNEGIFKYDVA